MEINSNLPKDELTETDIFAIFRDFIENTHNYSAILLDNLRKGKSHLEIDFAHLCEFNYKLGELLLEKPEDTLDSFECVLSRMDLSQKKIKVRVFHLPNTCNIPIWEIRKQVNKFIQLEGYISKMGNINLRPIKKVYTCNDCGNEIVIIAKGRDSKLHVPAMCNCKCKRLTEVKEKRELIPIREIYIEEDIMEIGARQVPRSKLVLLEDDLNSLDTDKNLLAGKRVVVNGWLETYEVNNKNNRDVLDTYFVANSIEFVERGWATIKIGDPTEFEEMAKSKDLIPTLAQSILPGIHGEKEVKHALLLQLAGANNNLDNSGFLEQRGCIHILLVGSPGTGKTKAAQKVRRFWPISRFTSAVMASGRGLVAIVERDKTLDKWVLIPGVLPTCHLGMLSLDELDKLDKEEYGFLNNAMNDLEVVIAKAASGKLDTDVAILATMNPTGEVLLPGPINDQIVALPSSLRDRFDLILPVRSAWNEEQQRNILRIGLNQRKMSQELEPLIPLDKVTRYFAYARTINPVIPDYMEKTIIDTFMKLTKPNNASGRLSSNRHFENLLRLLHASARLHLRREVTEEDLNEAMGLFVYSFKEMGWIDPSGFIKYEMVDHIDVSLANAVPLVKEAMRKLSQTMKVIPIEDVLKEINGKVSEDKIEEAIQKLKNVGELMEPRHGFLQMLV